MAATADDEECEYSKATIASLEAEIRQLREENRAASSERDSLQRDLESKQVEIQNLHEEILRTEKAHEEALLELQEEKKAHEEALLELREEKKAHEEDLLELREEKKKRYSIELMAQYRELERTIDLQNEEFTSIILSTLAAQSDLEEQFERKAKALQFLSEKALRMLKWTRETVCEEHEGEKECPVDGGDEVDDEGLKTMIEPFVSEVKKIRLGLLKLGIGSQSTNTTL